MCAIVMEQPDRIQTPNLMAQCAGCGRLSDDNLTEGVEGACERCGGDESRLVPRVGTVYSYSIVGQGAGAFVLALVQLCDGPLVMGRLVGVDRGLRIGLPVEFVSPDQPFLEADFGGARFAPPGYPRVVRT